MIAEPVSTEAKTPEERRVILAQAIQNAVARKYRIESQSDEMATVVYGKPVNHILHLILTLITLGLWGIIWAVMVMAGGERREMISVDPYGNLLVQKV